MYKEPREALEDPKTSSLFYSPCEREPQDGLPPHTIVRGRCTVVSGADESDPILIPRPLSLAEGDMDRLHGEPRFAGNRHRLSTGNRLYFTI